jgi:hypothetical protein
MKYGVLLKPGAETHPVFMSIEEQVRGGKLVGWERCGSVCGFARPTGPDGEVDASEPIAMLMKGTPLAYRRALKKFGPYATVLRGWPKHMGG